MMRKRLTLIALSVVLAVTTVSGQESPEAGTVTVPDEVMQQVVGRVLSWYFRSPPRLRIVRVSERGIKSEWFPSIPNVKFELASDNDALAAKNGVFLFDNLDRVGRHFSVRVGWGDFECRGFGDVWEFRVPADNKVRLWRAKDQGWGRGCGGSGPPTVRGVKLGEVTPNELRGYEFFKEGRLRGIALAVSTKRDIEQIFGDSCETPCNYDATWQISADYFEDRVEFSQTITDDKVEKQETEYTPKPQFVDRLKAIRFTPRKQISFRKMVFPRTFGESQTHSIGDDWDENGFAGAVHTTATVFSDGYGLSYTVYVEETFNNLRNKPPETDQKTRKGDLVGIDYEIPDKFMDVIYTGHIKRREKN